MDVLVSGATSGIGLELTKHLSSKHKIYILGRNEQKLKELESAFNVTPIKADVSNFPNLKRIFGKTGNLDVLINCAGILGPVGRLGENNVSDWEQTIKTNLIGTMNCCKLAIPLLLKSRAGKIINFAGGGSAYPRPFHTAYAASKTAVVRFTEILALEYPTLDINVIAPGAHKTKMWTQETHDTEPKEWGDMEKLKKFIDFLISEKSKGVSGRFLHYKDPWDKLDPKNLSKDIYTLRRVEK